MVRKKKRFPQFSALIPVHNRECSRNRYLSQFFAFMIFIREQANNQNREQRGQGIAFNWKRTVFYETWRLLVKFKLFRAFFGWNNYIIKQHFTFRTHLI